MTSTEHVRTFDDLPENARKYVELIEDKLGLPGTFLYILDWFNAKCYDMFTFIIFRLQYGGLVSARIEAQ